MEYYIVKIEVCGSDTYVEVSSEMPCILADKIKEVVREFYKDADD